MKKIYLSFCLLFLFNLLFATHNKGGEITYKCINVQTRTFEVTITTYTQLCPGCPDRPSLDSVHWGDGTMQTFMRFDYVDYPGDSIRKNRYIATHTYLGNGTFRIYFIDPNRNQNIVNIPNSVNIPFCTESYLRIHPAFCINNSVQFEAPPIFFGQVGRPFVHNLTVQDPDHDSLSFELITPLASPNMPVPGYTIPGDFSVSSVSGQIRWNTSTGPGQGDYGFAVKINEWRLGNMVGYVIRDFQLSLIATFPDTLNTFSPLSLSQDAWGNYFTSVNPGDTVNVHAVYHYSNLFIPPITSYGRAFSISNPPVVQYSSAPGTAIADFTWITDTVHSCLHPYIFTLRGTSTSRRQTDLTFLVYVSGAVPDTSCSYIGFNELEENGSEIIIFPNPATNELTIDNGELKIESVEIYSMLGEKVFHSQISNLKSQISVDVSQLPSGIYFVRIKTDKEEMFGKFVKQ